MTSRTTRSALALAVLALAWAGQAPAASPNDLLPDDPAKPLVVRVCTTCHQAPQIIAKRRTAEEWDQMMGKMVDRGAQATDAEQDQIIAYLAKNFGPETAPK